MLPTQARVPDHSHLGARISGRGPSALKAKLAGSGELLSYVGIWVACAKLHYSQLQRLVHLDLVSLY